MGTVGFKAPLGWDRSGATATFSWGLLAAAKKLHCIVHGKLSFANLSKVIWLGVGVLLAPVTERPPRAAVSPKSDQVF